MSTPYRCPVCEGRGNVPAGFYARLGPFPDASGGPPTDTCRACAGSGIVWSSEAWIPLRDRPGDSVTVTAPDTREIATQGVKPTSESFIMPCVPHGNKIPMGGAPS